MRNHLLADMKSRTERSSEDTPRRFPQVERAARLKRLAQRLPGLKLTDHMEPSNHLVDLVASIVDSGALRYIPWSDCLSRPDEVNGQKRSREWRRAMESVIQSASVRLMLAPLPYAPAHRRQQPSSPEQPSAKRARASAKACGKPKPRPALCLPAGLELSSRTPNGASICFAYNYGNCPNPNKGCPRGRHVCTKRFKDRQGVIALPRPFLTTSVLFQFSVVTCLACAKRTLCCTRYLSCLWDPNFFGTMGNPTMLMTIPAVLFVVRLVYLLDVPVAKVDNSCLVYFDSHKNGTVWQAISFFYGYVTSW